MKRPATMLSCTSLLLVLALLSLDLCSARELKLYRVDGGEDVKLHRETHDLLAQAEKTASNLNQDSYVKATIVAPTEKDAKYRSEEAKLHQERRQMFFRNLQLGSSSMSMSPEATYQSWDVLNSAIEAEKEQNLGYEVGTTPEESSGQELLSELVGKANKFAGKESGVEPELRAGVQTEGADVPVEAEVVPEVKVRAGHVRGSKTKAIKVKGTKTKKLKGGEAKKKVPKKR